MTALAVRVRKDLADTWYSLTFELEKHIRRRRVLITVLLAVLVPLLFYIVPRAAGVGFAATSTGFASSSLGFASLLILVSAAFFGGDALSSEIDKRTFLVSFVAPQRRTSIFAGKFFAALIATSAVVILYYLITFVEMEFVYGWGEVPIAFATSFAMAILYAFVALTVAFTFSALMRSTITSNMLSFFTLLLVLPIMSTLLSVAGVNPWLIPTYYSSLITDVFGSVGGFGPPVTLAFSPNFHTGVPVIVGWVTGLLAVSAFVTARRQME